MQPKTVLPFNLNVQTDHERMRHDTFWTKEPETINWIKSFPDNNVFLDIGSNIGIYSLYNAHLHPGSLSIACEPFLANFLRIHNNMTLNPELGSRILALPIAFSNENAFLPLYLPSAEIGSSGGQLYEPKDENGAEFPVAGIHDVMTFTVETFLNTFTHRGEFLKPTHVKIDVDGQEGKILSGLFDPVDNAQVFDSIESLLIEFNHPGEQQKWTEILDRKGFTTDNSFNTFVPHSATRRYKEGIKAVNIIYTRKVVETKEDK